MIAMSCPRCGAGGRVPREKVNSRLVCRKCLQVFHLGPDLHPMLGEPPAPKDAHRERAHRERVEFELPGLEGLGDLGEKLSKIKIPDAQTIAVTAGVLLVISFFWWLFTKPSLKQRSDTLAAAIRKLDLEIALGMAMPGTETETMKWVGEVYKQYLDLKLNIGNLEPGVQISTQENSDGSAQSLVEFSRLGAVSNGPLSVEQAATLEPPVSDAKKTMQLIIIWAKDTWGTWRLDGKRTADSATRSG